MPPDTKAIVSDELAESAVETTPASTVVTRMTFDAPPAKVWKGLVYYEEIRERPPLHLRLLLPVPKGTEGKKSQVGSEAKCLYEGGHLMKRTTNVEEGKVYEFIVAKQALSVGGSMRLSGGRYTLEELPGDRTEVSVETRYTSSKWPRWFWKPLETMVCHWFHRFLLRSMRRKIQSQ